MRYDDVIIGAGHNGLTAAAYLARAGRRVLVLERSGHVGGAAVSVRAFEGVDARLSRYAYLVSLLPRQIIADLELNVRLERRRFSSYTPVPGDPTRGVLVDTATRPPRASASDGSPATTRPTTAGPSSTTAWPGSPSASSRPSSSRCGHAPRCVP